jgi:hypothetical protein
MDEDAAKALAWLLIGAYALIVVGFVWLLGWPALLISIGATVWLLVWISSSSKNERR